MAKLLCAMLRKRTLILISGLLFSACSRQAVPPEHGPDRARGDSVSFVNKVWRVSSSSSVAPGTLYVFMSEGTLLITSPNSKPALGTWKYEGEALTMVEEGIPYRVDILMLSGDALTIRRKPPGTPLATPLVPPAHPPLPPHRPLPPH